MIEIMKAGYKVKPPIIYIGRPSPYGNPYPIVASKYSDKIYTLEKSLELYELDIRSGKINIQDLYEQYKAKGYLKLSCFCTNKKLHNWQQAIDKPVCHGEIIAYWIFKMEERDR